MFFYKSIRVQKLCEILIMLSESMQAGGYRVIPDVDKLVSSLRIRADNSLCFVLGQFSLPQNAYYQFNLCNGSCDIELVLVNPNIFTGRTISIHKLRIQGDRLLTDENGWHTYNLDLSQDGFVEKDPAKNCTIYPNNESESYGKCDQAYIEKIFPGIVSIWNTDDISKATRNLSMTENEKVQLAEITDGLIVSPCKLPCTSTKAQLNKGSAVNANENQPIRHQGSRNM